MFMPSPALRVAKFCMLLTCLTGLAATAEADIVRLKGGGQLRGTLERSQENARKGIVVIKTLSGSRVVLDRKQVLSTERRSGRVEEYETRARILPDTVRAHWELANWCETNSLRDQRDHHLQRLLVLQPDHEPSHRVLGHRLVDGKWMTEDAYMVSQGYVKHGGRYITPQERELLERSSEDVAKEREWFKSIRLWKTWLGLRNQSRQAEALFELQRITDPLAVPGLKKNFEEESDVKLRHLYVSILGQVDGNTAVGPLIDLYLIESDYEVRYLALNFIKGSDRQTVLDTLLPHLRDDNNTNVRRAAVVLQKVGDQTAVPALIDALVTRHIYRVQVPDRSGTMSFGTDGSMGGAQIPAELMAAIQAGQYPNGVIIRQPEDRPVRYRTVAITKDLQNTEVLDALKTITGQNFGFESGTWRLWWTSQKNSIN